LPEPFAFGVPLASIGNRWMESRPDDPLSGLPAQRASALTVAPTLSSDFSCNFWHLLRQFGNHLHIEVTIGAAFSHFCRGTCWHFPQASSAKELSFQLN